MEPICHNCAHFFVPTKQELDPEMPTCTAFYPNAIPEDILLGEFAHFEPHPQQQNPEILFLSLSPLKKEGT